MGKTFNTKTVTPSQKGATRDTAYRYIEELDGAVNAHIAKAPSSGDTHKVQDYVNKSLDLYSKVLTKVQKLPGNSFAVKYGRSRLCDTIYCEVNQVSEAIEKGIIKPTPDMGKKLAGCWKQVADTQDLDGLTAQRAARLKTTGANKFLSSGSGSNTPLIR